MIRLRAFWATTEIPENSPFTLKNAENSVKKAVFRTNSRRFVRPLVKKIKKLLNNSKEKYKNIEDEINELGKKAIYISDFNNIANYLKNHVHGDDIIITLGAGTITNLSKYLI